MMPSQMGHWRNSYRFRLGLLLMLGMTEMLPVAMLSKALPALLRRSGASMAQLGILSLFMLPWALKALWAPLVDKLGATSRTGRYRSWIFVTHPLLFLTLVLGSFFDIHKLLLGNQSLAMPALLWLSLIASTADTASHGLAVNLLSPEERGVGNGVQNAGTMLGYLLGGGVMVMLVDWLGWSACLRMMSGLVLLPLVGVALFREAPVDSAHAITLRETVAFFFRKRVFRWLLVLAVMAILPEMTAVPFYALFVDHGMSLTEIGLVLGLVGSGTGILASLFAGWLIKEVGRERAFYALMILCTVCVAVAAVLLTRKGAGRPMLYTAVILAHLGLAAIGTLLCTMIMDRSRSHLASTDYTLQSSARMIFALLGSSAGGVFAGYFGATSLFLMFPVLMLSALLLFSRILDSTDFHPTPYAAEETP